MRNPTKHWRCVCVICTAFKVQDVEPVQAYLGVLRKRGLGYPIGGDVGYGCDFCGTNSARLPACPPAIKAFFEIESFCENCRDSLCRYAHEADWHICWADTSEDEIKWFLVGFVARDFQHHFAGREFIMWWQCCVTGAHARRASKPPKPYSEIWRERHPEWAREQDEAERRSRPPEIRIRIRERSSGRFI